MAHPPLMNLDTSNVVDALIVSVPEIGVLIARERDMTPQLVSSNYSVFANIVRPYLFGLTQVPDRQAELLKIMLFFEQMASSKSIALEDVLLLEVVEPLVKHKPDLAAAWPFMGQKMRELVRRVQKPQFYLVLTRLVARIYAMFKRFPGTDRAM